MTLGVRGIPQQQPNHIERDAVLLVGRTIAPTMLQQPLNNSVMLHLLQANANNPLPMLELPTHMVGAD